MPIKPQDLHRLVVPVGEPTVLAQPDEVPDQNQADDHVDRVETRHAEVDYKVHQHLLWSKRWRRLQQFRFHGICVIPRPVEGWNQPDVVVVSPLDRLDADERSA